MMEKWRTQLGESERLMIKEAHQAADDPPKELVLQLIIDKMAKFLDEREEEITRLRNEWE
jgi:hypothetical protein